MAMKVTKRDKEFAHKVLETEGLGYSLEGYFPADVSDQVDSYLLAQLWEQTSYSYEQLNKLLQYIEEADVDGEGNG